jgi:thermolabile hemolysin
MYVFGDSLSALSGGGTQHPPPPGASVDNYWNGRYSNGRVWVEYLADRLGISFNTNTDFARFGNGSPSVYRTLIYGNFYPPPDLGTSLCVYWPACSDCFALAIYGGTNDWSSTFPEFVSTLTNTIGLLYSEGMRTVLIPNSVDVSLVPFFTHTLASLGAGAIAPNGVPSQAAIHAGVIQYNAVLATAIGQMRAQYPSLEIYAPDFYTQFSYGLSHPDLYGLTKVNIDALEDPALTDKSFDGPGADYVFWDYLHPTTKVHSFMAAFAAQAFAGPMFQQLSVQGGSLRLDLADLPMGRTGTLETKTDLVTQTAWTTWGSFSVTNSSQTVFVATGGLGNRRFFRLSFPP